MVDLFNLLQPSSTFSTFSNLPSSAIGAETSLRAKRSRGTIFAIIDLRTFACCDSFADLADVAVGPVQIRVLAGIAAPAE